MVRGTAWQGMARLGVMWQGKAWFVVKAQRRQVMDTRKINDIVDEAAEKISSIAEGTILPHVVMEDMLGTSRLDNKERYYSLMGKLRDQLKQRHGIFLKTERKVGYSIALAGEEIDLCAGKVESGIKRVWRGIAEANLIRIDNIADADKKQRTISKAQKMSNILGLLRAGSGDSVADSCKQIM